MKKLTICPLLAILLASLFLICPAYTNAASDTITSTIVITVLDKPKDLGQPSQDFNQTLASQVKNVNYSMPEAKLDSLEQGGTKLQRYTIIERL